MNADTSPGLAQRLLLLARDIKLSHSVFALPFALLGGYLAAAHGGALLHQRWWTLLLIVLCMVLARTAAMTANRWADARLDAANPRTAGRAVPSGRVSRSFMFTAMLVSGGAFIVATAGFWAFDDNVWPLLLSPLVLLWLCAYSFTKRFTWLCHVYLGSALALSPVAAAIAVEPSFLGRSDIWLLAAMVTGWVAGFDVIYALQDIEVDRRDGLYSMPSRLGSEKALWISRTLHLGSFAALVGLAAVNPPLGIAFTIGIAVVAALLILEHALVWGSRTRHLPVAFLTVNGMISLLLGGLGIVDVVRNLS